MMREYLPKVLGNAEIRNRIGAMIVGDYMPHAFLITGPEGSGKKTLAIEIAAAMNCERRSGDGPLPCGVCNCCRRIRERNYTDVKILEKPKERATLGVEPIKQLREDMFLSATESSYKIYVISDAHSMTPEAQNALLKVLEEPPSNVIIMLLATEADKMLTTIRSRVQTLAMTRFTPDLIRLILLEGNAEAREMEKAEPERFRAIVMGADGRLGIAQKLLNKRSGEELYREREDVLRLLNASKRGAGYTAVHAAISALPQKRNELSDILELCINALRDLIAVRGASNLRFIFFTSPEECARLSEEIGTRRLFEVFDALCEAREYCAKNANVSNVLTGLASRIYAT